MNPYRIKQLLDLATKVQAHPGNPAQVKVWVDKKTGKLFVSYFGEHKCIENDLDCAMAIADLEVLV
jgi:hypothetical protein